MRDPRDALVSQYFSFAKSHYIPEGSDDKGPRQLISKFRKELRNISIDEFVTREAKPFNDAMMSYRSIIKDKSTLVLFYEDIIFDKKKFLLDICNHLQWKIDERGLSDILYHVDVQPDVEDNEKFVRKVTPGDHIEKLQPATVDALNEIMAEAMSVFGYAGGQSGSEKRDRLFQGSTRSAA